MIAVTGAAGFIGSNLAHRLAAEGHELLLVDHPLTPAKSRNLEGLERFPFMDHQAFARHLIDARPKLDAVFHLGACSSTTQTDWVYLESNNVDYTRRIWQWCVAACCPLVYASSAATYGDGSTGFDDRTPPDALRPLNLYGKSKNDFDAWVLTEIAAGHATPPGWAGLKFFNVFGPRELHKGPMASVVRHAYRQLRNTGEVRLFRSNDPAIADGHQRRDFIYVGDCLDHMLWFWRHPAASGIYNSGTGAANTFLALAEALFAALGQAPAIRFIDFPPHLAGKYQNYTQADLTKLRAAGYAGAPTPLARGVADTVAWLVQQGELACSADS